MRYHPDINATPSEASDSASGGEEHRSDEPSSDTSASASPAADVEAVARILAMSDEEIMAEPGAAEAAAECGKVERTRDELHAPRIETA